MKKEQKWEMRYEVPTADGWKEKVCYPKSEEQREKNFQTIKRAGYKLISCKKLYPFNTYKNQHNFELINNLCYNEMHDMELGEKPFDKYRFDELWDMQEKAEKFFCLPLPMAWLPWEDWKEAKRLSEMAIMHRQDACIENGRYDLVTYC